MDNRIRTATFIFLSLPLVVLLLFTSGRWRSNAVAVATPQGKGGEIIAKPSPTPAVKRTPTKRQPSRTSSPRKPMPRSFDFVTVTVDDSGNIKTRETRTATYYAEDLSGSVKLEMVRVPGGAFAMGSGFDDEKPQHRVNVPGFWMGKYEVTQAQYQAVMRMNPSRFKSDDLPVDSVSWNDAAEFCRRLSAKSGREYRLPTEAEWEYAARAGTTTPFAFGNTITPDLANYDGEYSYGKGPKGNYRREPVPVGSMGVANDFGLYDMHGNVDEWCQDWYHPNYDGAPNDGSAWLSGGEQKSRVLRGGSWDDVATYLVSTERNRLGPEFSHHTHGFRVVAVARTN